MIKVISFLALLVVVILIGYFSASKVKTTDFAHLKNLTPNLGNGEYVFIAAGCSNCHQSLGSTDELALAGGTAFNSTFGTIYAPNVSMSERDGIGKWTIVEFAKALKEGISPEGDHYFPAFPYTSYSKITDQDLVDLWEFWRTLPIIDGESKKHELKWPFSVRRNIGLWKLLYFSKEPRVIEDFDRGQYLAEALLHCTECHTPRTFLGGLQKKKWMQGGKNLVSKGFIPNITTFELNWSPAEISEYLLTGFTPDYDSAGGQMALVIDNTSRLTKRDRDAIAGYIYTIK